MRPLNILIANGLLSALFAVSFAALSPAQAVTPSSVMAPVDHLYRFQLSTGEVISDTLQHLVLKGAAKLSESRPAQWKLIGATAVSNTAASKLVYFDNANGALAVSFYGGPTHDTLLGVAPLAALPAGWTAQATADLAGDDNLDVIAVNENNGEVAAFVFGGSQGTSLVQKQLISGVSASLWNVVGAADLNADGHPDLILQNRSTHQIMVAYLGGSNGTTVTSTHNLESSEFNGWTAAGMQDMNGDGHPDLILVNDITGESIVNFYSGDMGFTYLKSAYLDASVARGWKIVVPTKLSSTTTMAASALSTTATATTVVPLDTATVDSTATLAPSGAAIVLIYNGSGTVSSDVTALESIVTSLGLSYRTANSSQLNSMSESQLLAYKLFIMPGGNSGTISRYLTKNTTANVHNAVSAGLNYLGMCAGAFTGSSSSWYNYFSFTSGRWFNVYNTGSGTGKRAMSISFPGGVKRDIYWQDGPNLNGWGKIVGKYPNGAPAITEGYWGKGFILFSAVHPEAPASWRYGMSFYTPLDVDLAYARTLVKSALNRTMLPHY